MIEDKLLIWKFKCGSKDALRRIYEKYKNQMLKLAVVLVNDVNAAEDTVQDVFVNFAQSAAEISLSGNLKKYFAVCVTNRIRNRKRDQQRHKLASINEANDVSCDLRRPEQWAILSEQLKMLSNAMARIPDEQREVIALYMQDEMTFKQIAKIQNVSVNTIQGRYRYGLDKLRSLLDSEVEK
jgi:RNA polymerase sigma-70 factor (ECF subfamily)